MEELPGCSFKSQPDLDAVAGPSGAASESRGKIWKRITLRLIRGEQQLYLQRGDCKILLVKLQFTCKFANY